MRPRYTLEGEDNRLFKKIQARLREEYPPRTIQHEVDLERLGRLNWQAGRIASLIDADLNQRLACPTLRKINDPALRILKATRRALGRREHTLLVKQNEANLRSTNILVTRVDKWNATR